MTKLSTAHLLGLAGLADGDNALGWVVLPRHRLVDVLLELLAGVVHAVGVEDAEAVGRRLVRLRVD